jgi:hypothetical protein
MWSESWLRQRLKNDVRYCYHHTLPPSTKEICVVEKPIAWKFISDRDGISEKTEGLGLQVDYVGIMIGDFIKQGFVPTAF